MIIQQTLTRNRAKTDALMKVEQLHKLYTGMLCTTANLTELCQKINIKHVLGCIITNCITSMNCAVASVLKLRVPMILHRDTDRLSVPIRLLILAYALCTLFVRKKYILLSV